jgi:hypothetical protein
MRYAGYLPVRAMGESKFVWRKVSVLLLRVPIDFSMGDNKASSERREGAAADRSLRVDTFS